MTDLIIGMKIKIEEPVFGGSYRKPKFLGNREFIGEIIKESYGGLRGQHTFTLEVKEATGINAQELILKKKIRRKGRNLYKNLIEIIFIPENAAQLQDEKHKRAKIAYDKKIENWRLEGKYEKLEKR